MASLTRREFARLGAAVTAACAAARPLAARTLDLPAGLQLYSVRDLLPKDFEGTLAAVHAAGYAVVEAAGFYGRTAAEFRRAMDTAGLRAVSAHFALADLETGIDQTIDYATALGLEFIVCASLSGLRRDPNAKGELTLDDWRWVADEYNRIGFLVKNAGMIFAVHNHTPEFAVLGRVLVYDELLRRTDPAAVAFEMDCGWVYAAGQNPVDFLARSPERFPLLHVKDMIRGPGGKMEMPVLGKGAIDYAPILRAATALRYYFVEQEAFDIDPMEELRQDAAYMRELRF
jgi:sugar phosphate isomerase/epimerase